MLSTLKKTKKTTTHEPACTDPDGQAHAQPQQLRRAMNYNTLCLKLSSCLHSSTLTSSLHHPLLRLPTPTAPDHPFSPPSSLSPLYSSSPSFILTQSISIYISSFHSLPLRVHFSYLLRPCRRRLLPSLHLISDTLTWLPPPPPPPLLPREAGEPLFPLIPANAICKHRQWRATPSPSRHQSLDGIKGWTGRNHSGRAAR